MSEALQRATDTSLHGLTPLLAIPEYKVPLPGGVRPSQNDLFVLASGPRGLVCIMVEGKVSESFGPSLGKWRIGASRGKELRLQFLLKTLGLKNVPHTIRYQLLHRAASSLITAGAVRATAAIMLIHSFSSERVGWSDYESFAALFGVGAIEGVVQRLGDDATIPLFAVWVPGNCSFLAS